MSDSNERDYLNTVREKNHDVRIILIWINVKREFLFDQNENKKW